MGSTSSKPSSDFVPGRLSPSSDFVPARVRLVEVRVGTTAAVEKMKENLLPKASLEASPLERGKGRKRRKTKKRIFKDALSKAALES